MTWIKYLLQVRVSDLVESNGNGSGMIPREQSLGLSSRPEVRVIKTTPENPMTNLNTKNESEDGVKYCLLETADGEETVEPPAEARRWWARPDCVKPRRSLKRRHWTCGFLIGNSSLCTAHLETEVLKLGGTQSVDTTVTPRQASWDLQLANWNRTGQFGHIEIYSREWNSRRAFRNWSINISESLKSIIGRAIVQAEVTRMAR